MANLARTTVPVLTALSLMIASTLAGAADFTTRQQPSTRDPHSTWVITSPTRHSDPVHHRHLMGYAHRKVDSTNQAPPEFYRTAAEAQAAGARKASRAAAALQGSSLQSFPTFFTSFVNNNTIESFGPGYYSFMGLRVGTDPATTNRTTTIPTYVVPVIITAPDGTVYNPRTRVPGQTGSTIEMALESPVFTSTNLQFAGHNFGNTQLMDAWVRAGDWATLSTKHQYHLMLGTPALLPPLRLTPSASQFSSLYFGSGSGLYGSTLNVLDIDYLDNQIRAYIANAQHTGAISPTGVPVFLTSYNVAAGGAGGYHDTDANQVYTWVGYFVSSQRVGNGYDDTKASPVRDGTVLEHEFAELIDHPFVETGDNGPCSIYGYETGDPLESGENDFVIPAANGRPYAFQDLTFYSYNIGDAPSKGINGQYTLQNTYTRACSGL